MTDGGVETGSLPETMWRERVRSHLDIGGWGSLTKLARVLGEPERSLRRWIYESGSPPRHEVRLLLKISQVFGWPLWYLMDDVQPYPPGPELLEVYRLRQQLPRETSAHMLAIAGRLVCETLSKFIQSHVELNDDMLEVTSAEAQNLERASDAGNGADDEQRLDESF